MTTETLTAVAYAAGVLRDPELDDAPAVDWSEAAWCVICMACVVGCLILVGLIEGNLS